MESRIDVDEPAEGSVRVTELSTTEAIVAHMTAFGPNSRVLLLVKDENCLLNAENGLIAGQKGLLSDYQGFKTQFSAANPRNQLTHHLGGVIQIATLERHHEFVMGMIYSLVVAECVPKGSSLIRQEARLQLRLPPFMWIESIDGVQQAQVTGE